MKARFYMLIGLAAFALSACDLGKQRTTTPEKLAQYTKHICRKWRIDSAFMKREVEAYWDTVYQVAHRVIPGSENYARGVLEGAQDHVFRELMYRQVEFFPDGKRITKHSRYPQTGKHKYAFNSTLDSLYEQDDEGETEEIFKVASISDTALVLIKDLYLPTHKLENRRFFKARFKYVPDKAQNW